MPRRERLNENNRPRGLFLNGAEPDRRAIERACARIMASHDGEILMRHIEAMAFLRPLGPDCASAQLYYAEGQRALALHILRLAQAGRQP
jgi:hypothetical protein